ncbi:MAG: hypothetical protein ACREF7_02020, partial [Candidatus Saccharimonadales bacterium]
MLMFTKHIRFKVLSCLIAISTVIGALFMGAGAGAVNQLIAQGYSSSSNLQPGMIVRLDSSSSNKVSALDISHINQMLGVVISANDAALTLSQTTALQEVYVSNFGQHNVLVTNQNGPIKAGDYITISALAGLGMKADSNESFVLGQAASNFDGVHNVLSTSSLASSGGQKVNLSIGSIPVNISIASNPLAQGARGVPAFITKLTKFATNKSVSASRVYLGMLCVVAGLIITITIIYSGIKNGFISIGRNPLAKKAISLNLIRVVAISIVIFAISLGSAYAIITTQ